MPIFVPDLQSVRQTFSTFSLLKFILNVIPVLKWLPSYSIKAHLPGDISAGITVAVMHIPQGNFYNITGVLYVFLYFDISVRISAIRLHRRCSVSLPKEWHTVCWLA